MFKNDLGLWQFRGHMSHSDLLKSAKSPMLVTVGVVGVCVR